MTHRSFRAVVFQWGALPRVLRHARWWTNVDARQRDVKRKAGIRD
jgi:hypothetical protein